MLLERHLSLLVIVPVMSAAPLLLLYRFEVPFIGSLVCSLLYGFTSFQGLEYFRRFPTDGWYLKSLVVAIMIIDSIHLAFCLHFSYHYFIAIWNKPGFLFIPIWSAVITPFVKSLAEMLCHLFAAARIWKLSGKKWGVPLCIIALEISRTG
ncbi:hypothetical protein SISSUDRAFT_1054560 [Sistotremastrum suecicum HHB10207 ss-3]|nr:hypothetical protein SISSUDRAFT_1054560 [Sistotremastrum suecicum HHB10207 ss-3]